MFKSKWSARDMTEEDRKKIFWYIRRKTSYTAWKREADAFDKFADLIEKQIKEEPVADSPMVIEPVRWERYFPEVLKCQVLYEKSLERLKQGDRSIWLYNDLGILDDAVTIASSWHVDMVNHGRHGDVSFAGKYVPNMEQALKTWYSCAVDTGYCEPQFTDVPAPESWTSFWYDRYAQLPLPSFLPDVPQPKEEVLIRSGERVPVFGIYEPQVQDGCMNYLLGDSSAPEYEFTDGRYATGPRPVTWRLIWADDRYLDGHISSEEEGYFPTQAKPVEASPVFVGSDLISARTGQTCPKAGNWSVMSDLQGKAVFNKSDKMPQYLGHDVTWVWSD